VSALALTLSTSGIPDFAFWRTEMQRSVARRAKVCAVAAAEERSLDDERRLVELAKAGDRGALGALLSHHGPRLFRSILLPRLGDEARARDALSATYERAIQRLDRYEWQPCGLYPWLRVVAMRIALDMLRSGRRELLFDAEDLGRELDRAEAALEGNPTSHDALQERRDQEVARAKVSDALAAINPRYAQAIRLRVLEERPRNEVAELMGVTPATFDVLLHRSLAALKKAIRSDGTEGRES
jgi:RNA polymerase sigma-70 factor (ECF subfamily)